MRKNKGNLYKNVLCAQCHPKIRNYSLNGQCASKLSSVAPLLEYTREYSIFAEEIHFASRFAERALHVVTGRFECANAKYII